MMFPEGLNTHHLTIDAKVSIHKTGTIELEHADAGCLAALHLTPDEAIELATVLVAAARRATDPERHIAHTMKPTRRMQPLEKP